MTTSPDNRAFPLDGEEGFNSGLTKREYFATAIIQGIISNPEIAWIRLPQCKLNIQDLEVLAIKMADALIKELNKESK